MEHTPPDCAFIPGRGFENPPAQGEDYLEDWSDRKG